MSQQRYKIVLIGDVGVGKTTFVNHYLHNVFTSKYVPSINVDIHSISFNSNYGHIIFDIWDIPGNKIEILGGIQDVYYSRCDGIFLFYDLTNKESYTYCNDWIDENQHITNTNFVVQCGNKVDETLDIKFKQDDRILFRSNNTVYYDLSILDKINLDNPLLWLGKKLTGHADLELIRHN